MAPQAIFLIDMSLGYLAWALCIAVYVWPWLKAMDGAAAQRIIATFHSFRFFGLVFLLPGFVGQHLPQGFAAPAAYGDIATGLLAILTLLTFRIRPLFWLLVVAFNIVGLGDLIIDTANASRLGLPNVAGELGAAYAIPMLYVPALFWTHIVAFVLMLRSLRKPATAAA
ncbi:MAG: hypothetical protein JSR55_16305 [Proteobacteria bacterium]|nr:hypothetical protein [Pseudomonadota bacterium]